MPGRGRRLALALILAAFVLAAGRWIAAFAADRMWEAAISEAVSRTGTQRALARVGLELLVVVSSTAWLLFHFVLAARSCGAKRLWPSATPRWSVSVVAILLGVLLGEGAGSTLDELRLGLDGARLGIVEPLTGLDLGVFLGRFPFWSGIQQRAVVLSLAALAGTLVLHAAGGAIRRNGHRLRVAPAARPQLAVLLAVLAIVLAWGAYLDPLRLAAGLRGPVLPSEFGLLSLMAYLGAWLGGVAALLSLLWWAVPRVRGTIVLVGWMAFGLARAGEMLLPVHPGDETRDPAWREQTRTLDTIAFQLAGLERAAPPPAPPRGLPPAASMTPTLWDDSIAARALGVRPPVQRGWLPAGSTKLPVWLAVGETPGERRGVVALSEDRVASTGAPLFYRQGDLAAPAPGYYRRFPAAALVQRPRAPRVEIALPGEAGGDGGVLLHGWIGRVLLAWAWQVPGTLTAPRGARVGWRLDPGERLHAVAPFAHWSTPRLRVLESQLVWQSDGLLISRGFPGSSRIPWTDGSVSMVRSAFMGTVDAATGAVRVYRRNPADPFSAVWARVNAPLVESAASIPEGLRDGEPYPAELALAQGLVLAGPAWGMGRLDQLGGDGVLPPEAPGGSERSVPFRGPRGESLVALLSLRRTPGGDSLRLIRLNPDSTPSAESAALLKQRWGRFPFQEQLRDSVLAAGARFETGAVRYALVAEGVAAYQPAWAESREGRPRLALVNVALGKRLGTGRTFAEAWRNLRGEVSPASVGAGAQALLEEVRRWWQHADSARQRGDLAELGRALAYLRELLERQP